MQMCARKYDLKGESGPGRGTGTGDSGDYEYTQSNLLVAARFGLSYREGPIPLPPGQNQKETDPAHDDHNDVEHVFPTLGLEGLNQEDVEPAAHGEQCR